MLIGSVAFALSNFVVAMWGRVCCDIDGGLDWFCLHKSVFSLITSAKQRSSTNFNRASLSVRGDGDGVWTEWISPGWWGVRGRGRGWGEWGRSGSIQLPCICLRRPKGTGTVRTRHLGQHPQRGGGCCSVLRDNGLSEIFQSGRTRNYFQNQSGRVPVR